MINLINSALLYLNSVDDDVITFLSPSPTTFFLVGWHQGYSTGRFDKC